MKRRKFLKVFAGSVGVAALPSLRLVAPVAPSGELVLPLSGAGVMGDAVLTGNEEALFGLSAREQCKAHFAQWFQNEIDRRTLDALTKPKS